MQDEHTELVTKNRIDVAGRKLPGRDLPNPGLGSGLKCLESRFVEREPITRVEPVVGKKPPKNPGAVGRYWILTLSCAAHPERPTMGGDMVWVRGQREVGLSGFEHWQFVCCFNKNVRQSVVKSIWPAAHIELTRSSAANDYVWKEDTRVEGSQFEIVLTML